MPSSPDASVPPTERTIHWWLAGWAILLIGGWLAWQITREADPSKPIIVHFAPAGGKPRARPDVRPLADDQRPPFSIQSYVERCQRGLTPTEARWILEDFIALGLDRGVRTATTDDFLQQRKHQQNWYLELLAEGLSMDAGQKRQAGERLNQLLETAFQETGNESKPFEVDGKMYRIVTFAMIDRWIKAREWLMDERYAPWELTELTAAQREATWHGWLAERAGGSSADPDASWLDLESVSLMDYDKGRPNLGDFPTGQAPAHVTGAGAVLPFRRSQNFGGSDDSHTLESQVLTLHPSQFKFWLLIHPSQAADLLERMSKRDTSDPGR